jgi:hypothetical protein
MQTSQPHRECDLCHEDFAFGAGKYAGRHLPEWNVYLCRSCRCANHDGIQVDAHPGFLDLIDARGGSYTLDGNLLWLPPSGSV